LCRQRTILRAKVRIGDRARSAAENDVRAPRGLPSSWTFGSESKATKSRPPAVRTNRRYEFLLRYGSESEPGLWVWKVNFGDSRERSSDCPSASSANENMAPIRDRFGCHKTVRAGAPSACGDRPGGFDDDMVAASWDMAGWRLADAGTWRKRPTYHRVIFRHSRLGNLCGLLANRASTMAKISRFAITSESCHVAAFALAGGDHALAALAPGGPVSLGQHLR
jgi:hypothetical protein